MSIHGLIYLITDTTNGRVYVGQTVQTLKQRWASHVSSAKKGVRSPLCEAIRTHGFASFTIVELEQCSGDLGVVELKWIKHYDSTNPDCGYNVLHGGSGVYSPEERQRRSEASKRQWANPATREKMRQAMKAANADPDVRRKHSESSRAACARPEVQARMVSAIRERLQDPAQHARCVENAVALATDSAVQIRRRESLARVMGTPEMRARLSAAKKKYWADRHSAADG